MKHVQNLHQACVAAVQAETKRTLRILAEARSLGIPGKHVDAALAGNMTAEEFVTRYAPVEAKAREIVTSARAAGI